MAYDFISEGYAWGMIQRPILVRVFEGRWIRVGVLVSGGDDRHQLID